MPMASSIKAPAPNQKYQADQSCDSRVSVSVNSSEENFGTQFSESTSTDVWENLREIFADIDAHSESSESKVLLKKPIMHLRRLLQIHSEIRKEEQELDKVYLGVLYEREWFMRKLQAIEAAVGPSSMENGQGTSAAASFAMSIRNILYEDGEDFSLVGCRWQPL